MSTLYTKEGVHGVCAKALAKFTVNRLSEHGTLLYAAVTGSHLYGCSHEASDFDVKGVFLPFKDLVLNYEHPRSISAKMESDEGLPIDIEVWSLQWFQKILRKGDSNSLDLLFAPSHKEMVLFTAPNFFEKHFTQENIEEKILFNKMTGLSGYCYRQAEKYGIKGSRLNDLLNFKAEYTALVDEVIKEAEDRVPDGAVMTNRRDDIRLSEVWDRLDLSKYNHIKMVELNKHRTDEQGLSLLGRIAPHYLKLTQVEEMMDRISGEFGKRTMNALEGTDWKAMSHAYRAGYEYLSLLNDKKIVFPLECGPKLLSIKMGEIDVDIVKSEIAEMLEEIGRLDGTMFNRKKPSYNFLKSIVLDYYGD